MVTFVIEYALGLTTTFLHDCAAASDQVIMYYDALISPSATFRQDEIPY